MSNDIVNNQGDSITLDISNMSAEQLYIHIVELYHSTEHTLYIGNLDLVRGDYFDKKNNELKKIKKDIAKIEHELEKALKREESYKEDILALKKDIGNYKRYYGEYTSPFDILNSLFKSSDKTYLDSLSILNPKSKLGFNTKAIDYWLGVFEDLGVTRRIDRGRYQAMVGFKEANDLLHEFIEKQGIKE